jgi:hypothetical protein
VRKAIVVAAVIMGGFAVALFTALAISSLGSSLAETVRTEIDERCAFLFRGAVTIQDSVAVVDRHTECAP